MKELLKSEITDIRWWRDDGGDIDPSLVDDLLSLAKRRVFRMGEQGYTSGELYYEVDDSDTYYRGSWETSEYK
jgi:hypothetical protein